MPRKKENINPERGIRLSSARRKRNITQEKLAELSDYSIQTISGIENGTRRMTLESANIFAKVLSLRPEYLMCKDDYPTALDVYHKRNDSKNGKESLLDDIFRLLSYQTEYSKSASTYQVLCKEYDLISAHDTNIPYIFNPDNPDTFNDMVILTDYNLNKREISLEKYVSLKNEILEFIEFKLQKLMKEGESNETP